MDGFITAQHTVNLYEMKTNKNDLSGLMPTLIIILMTSYGAMNSVYNRPVSRKLKYLRNVNDHQLTAVAQHPGAIWRP